jgi:hypothetical protein
MEENDVSMTSQPGQRRPEESCITSRRHDAAAREKHERVGQEACPW